MGTAETGSAARIEKAKQKVADNPDSAMAHAKLGTVLLHTCSSKQAEAELRKAIELDPNCIPALINLGGLLLGRWDFEGCVEVNQRAVAVDPEIVEAHFNQGLGHLYLSQAEQMVECFRRVVELDGTHPAGRYHLAVGLLACGKEKEAREELTIAMKLGYKPEPDFLKAFEKKQGGNPQVLDLEPKPSKQTH